MAQTRNVGVRVPDALLAAARGALGLPAGAGDSAIVRAALACVGQVDLTEHTPRRTGRPPARKARAA